MRTTADPWREEPEAAQEETKESGGRFERWVRRRVRATVAAVRAQPVSAEALALSIAVGITGGVFPIPGVTTLVCGVFIYLFKLNVAACQLVNFLLTPLELALVLPFIRLGELIFNVSDPLPFSPQEFATLLSEGFFGSLSLLGGSFLRAVAAWALVSVLATFLLYFVLLRVLSWIGTKYWKP